MSQIQQSDLAKLDDPRVTGAVFHPRLDGADCPPGSIDFAVEVGNGVTLGARYHPASTLECANILFFHGNGETIYDYDAIAPEYTRRQVGFFAVDYRGYGRSTGMPSVSTMLSDAHLVLDFMKKYLAEEGRNGHLAVMGRSLGSACAIELASGRMTDIDGLIVESGFAHTMPILRVLGVDPEAIGITEQTGFSNLDKIKQVKKPCLFLHAMKDELIPLSEAADLQAECGAASKELQMVPGAGHNTIMERGGATYFEIISKFCGKLGRPTRPKRKGVRG